MKVTAIGRTRILSETIERLDRAGHDIERIVTCEAASHYPVTGEDLRRQAAELGAEFEMTGNLNTDSYVQLFRSSSSSVAVSVNWKSLIRDPVLESFEHGVINAHAGDLPRYRGNAAPNWAIIADEDEVVLTLHRLTEELDAGPVLRQESVPLDDEIYIGDIYERMYERFPVMFVSAVEGLEDGTLEPRPQSKDPTDALRCYPRIPKDSELEWGRSAETLARLVRASSDPLFGAYTWFEDEKLTVWRAHAAEPAHEYHGTPGQVAHRSPESGTVSVITGDGFLVLETVELPNTGRVPATDAIDSIRTRLGMDKTKRIHQLEAELRDLRHELED